MRTDNEYWKRVCETDAEWKSFCKISSKTNWKAYVEAKIAEDKAKKELNNEN